MADRAGQQLGNYRLERLLGRGGFAEVYLGEHLRLGTQAAIKVLSTQLASDEENIFQQEARTIARLEHPHIVRVLDFDVQDGTPFLVMSYAPNGTLRTRHARGSQLALETIVPYVRQVAEALAYAHEEKLVHRDIKPENMLVGRRAEVLLSDFGIATMAQSSRYQGTQDVAGTVAYMAPEQVQGKPRPASDQYSLGIVVYEWLTGTRPFHGGFTEIATQHVLTPPPPLREKLPAISPAVEQAVLIALAKDPKERFATVQAFATALEQAALLDQPTQFVRPTMPLTPSSSLPTQRVPPAQAATVVVPQSRLPGSAPSAPPARPSQQMPASPPARRAQPPLSAQSLDRPLYVYRGHIDDVNALAWSPDSSLLISGSKDATVHVWGAAGGEPLVIYRNHTGAVYAVGCAPDGDRVVSAGHDRTARVWSIRSRSQPVHYSEHAAVRAVSWSPDGERIASSCLNAVKIWNPFTGGQVQLPYTSHTAQVSALAWSPGGSRVASATVDGRAHVWTAGRNAQGVVYRGHPGHIAAVAWSPDDRYVLSGGNDKTVQVWNALNGTRLLKYSGHSQGITSAVWSPDGKRIASSSWDGTVQVYSATFGELLLTYRGHSGPVLAVAWSPDGTRIASAGRDKTVQVWQAPKL